MELTHTRPTLNHSIPSAFPGEDRSTTVCSVVGSLLLHILFALLIALALRNVAPPPAEEEAVPVQLLEFAEIGPSFGREAGPQQQQPSPLSSRQPSAASADTTPPASQPAVQAPPPPRPQPTVPLRQATPSPVSTPEGPKRTSTKHESNSTVSASGKPTSTRNEIERLLSLAENTHREATTPSPRMGTRATGTAVLGDARDTMGATPASGKGGVKDVIRAQVERHWQFDLRDLGTSALVVTIHLQLAPDGHVRLVEIIEDPRYTADAQYRALANSARAAAILSSPFNLPPGTYDAFKDVVLTLNPRTALR